MSLTFQVVNWGTGNRGTDKNGSKISTFGPYFSGLSIRLRQGYGVTGSFALHFQVGFASWRARLWRAVSCLSANLVCPPCRQKCPLLFHAGETPTLPSIAAQKGARASCPPEPGRLRHFIGQASALPGDKPFAYNKIKEKKEVTVCEKLVALGGDAYTPRRGVYRQDAHSRIRAFTHSRIFPTNALTH